MHFPLDPNEMFRLETIQQLGFAKLIHDPVLDRVTTFAAEHFRVPISLITLVENDCVRMVSDQGLNLPQAPRADVFCAHTILGPDVLVIPDMLKDDRFRSNPLVTGEPRIRFYAGAPLAYNGDTRLGSLCVMDTKSRTLTRGEQAELAMLAEYVMAVVVARSMNLPDPDLSAALSI
jgi:GAF domain-containing protein